MSADAAEDELVDRAREGDVDACSELVRRSREAVYRTIYRFTKNHSDTDDIAQETFLRAFRGIRHFKKKAGFSTWVIRIAINQSLNFLKKKKKEKGMKTFEERMAGGKSGWHYSPDSAVNARELGRNLHAAIDSLPPVYRSAFILVILEGMRHGQAARILGCSENTVSWRVHKARKMIQAKLEPYVSEARHGM